MKKRNKKRREKKGGKRRCEVVFPVKSFFWNLEHKDLVINPQQKTTEAGEPQTYLDSKKKNIGSC